MKREIGDINRVFKIKDDLCILLFIERKMLKIYLVLGVDRWYCDKKKKKIENKRYIQLEVGNNKVNILNFYFFLKEIYFDL